MPRTCVLTVLRRCTAARRSRPRTARCQAAAAPTSRALRAPQPSARPGPCAQAYRGAGARRPRAGGRRFQGSATLGEPGVRFVAWPWRRPSHRRRLHLSERGERVNLVRPCRAAPCQNHGALELLPGLLEVTRLSGQLAADGDPNRAHPVLVERLLAAQDLSGLNPSAPRPRGRPRRRLPRRASPGRAVRPCCWPPRGRCPPPARARERPVPWARRESGGRRQVWRAPQRASSNRACPRAQRPLRPGAASARSPAR